MTADDMDGSSVLSLTVPLARHDSLEEENARALPASEWPSSTFPPPRNGVRESREQPFSNRINPHPRFEST